MEFEGRKVLVTGSTSGIGFGVALSFYQKGASVYINGRSEDRVENSIKRMKEAGDEKSGTGGKRIGKLFPCVGDVATKEGMDVCANALRDVSIDTLVCNVGIFEAKDFVSITDEDWLKYFNSNVMTTVRVCRHFLPPMMRRNFGRVIIIASECGMKPIPDMIHYSVTKSAQIGLARGLAETTKGTGVTVNSVLPGPTATEGLVSYFRGLAEKEGQDEETVIRNYFKTKEPTSLIQRLIKVDEVAHVVLFLASEEAGAVNGNTQRVEGGIIRSI
eukprot:TRINITY_DN1601_c0_g1_i1.p1 TRINITY_DN1601_c0_g1~~TRINITY_DN1601_c0_g1_i1.p1  ORF type:complete len:273 (+),score=81.98 TRINITY_DN1601_c0_g1_i1:151-969(+)